MAPKKPASLKMRALQWLAQREHSRLELRGKLLRLLLKQGQHAAEASLSSASASASASATVDAEASGIADTSASGESPPVMTATEAAIEVDALLDWLGTHGYLSQQRFVESRVHARQSRYGNLRIQRELQMHGVSLDTAARQTLQATELERAREVLRKKFGLASANASSADPAARVRQMRFLSGRGFSPEVIRRVIRQRDDEGNDAGQDTTD